jgi:serine/threonine protein phosphatase 1
VIDRLARNPFPGNFIALKGNHEELLRAFLDDPSTAASWRRLGGLETLNSYGVDVLPLMRGKQYESAAAGLNAALPPEHVDFLASLSLSLTVGNYFLCHAGIAPAVPLAQQRAADLLWIREPFLGTRIRFDKIVVHGHTPVENPEVLPNRINVDTGAYMTGRLTCAVLEAGRVRFLATG